MFSILEIGVIGFIFYFVLFIIYYCLVGFIKFGLIFLRS